MSEYQYFEFQAIDRPLTVDEQEHLRQYSTRAEITATHFINEYNWGDFRGNKMEWMKRYFDAFLYVANFGTHELMLRVPRGLVDLHTAQTYAAKECLEIISTRDHVIFHFNRYTEEPEWEEGPDRLAGLLPVRHEILAGDLRALYLGWLGGVASGEVDDDEKEPPVPPGLSHLSASLEALADFLWLDDELIDAAAAGDTREAPTGPTIEAVAAWVKTLPVADKDAILVRLVEGEGAYLAVELLHRYHADHLKKNGAAPAAATQRRTAGELRELWEQRIEQERRREAQEQAQKAKKKTTARAQYLDKLAKRVPATWDQVAELIATKQQDKYDEAVKLLVDLRDAAQRAGDDAEFLGRMTALRKQHASKSSLTRRIRDAGL
jgi:hypothetical protein